MKTLNKYESPFETLLGNWLNDEFIGLPTREHSLKTLPAVNLIENNNNFSIELAAPGYDKKDFKIELDNYQLSVSLEKNTENNPLIIQRENLIILLFQGLLNYLNTQI